MHGLGPEVYEKVNVLGTEVILRACTSSSVRKLVFTSSGGVVYDGQENLVDVDERLGYPAVPLDAYNETKARAEKLVLDANGKDGLLTCAIRPAGIFGCAHSLVRPSNAIETDSHQLLAYSEGDKQCITGFLSVLKNGQTHFQLGDNMNLFDWTYVGNVAHAHLLACDRLGSAVPMEAFDEPLRKPKLSLRTVRIPTSDARPLGPNTSPSAEDRAVAARYADESTEAVDDSHRPVLRTRFDQFAAPSVEFDEELDEESDRPPTELTVAGQAFFITNGEPLYFWDFARAVWAEFGHVSASTWALPKAIGVVLASAAETYSWLMRREPGFTVKRVQYATQARYYSIEKAQRVLGYEPVVGVSDAIKKTCDWFKKEEAAKVAAK